MGKKETHSLLQWVQRGLPQEKKSHGAIYLLIVDFYMSYADFKLY